MAYITYVPTGEGWLNHAAVMGLCTRKMVRLVLKGTQETELALEAFDRAVAIEDPDEELIHHSDRGVQYSSLRYQQRRWDRGMICSTGRNGNCYDNAVMESFFHTLKGERVDWREYATRKETAEDLNCWIGTWNNQKGFTRAWVTRPLSSSEKRRKLLDEMSEILKKGQYGWGHSSRGWTMGIRFREIYSTIPLDPTDGKSVFARLLLSYSVHQIDVNRHALSQHFT